MRSWVTTSSPVVGSSSTTRSGLADQRHRRSARAAAGHPRAGADSDGGTPPSTAVPPPRASVRPGHPRWHPGNERWPTSMIASADSQRRIERAARILGHVGDHRPPQERRESSIRTVLAAELQRPGGDLRFRREVSPSNERAVVVLPEPDSPTMPEDLSRRQLQIDVLHDLAAASHADRQPGEIERGLRGAGGRHRGGSVRPRLRT